MTEESRKENSLNREKPTGDTDPACEELDMISELGKVKTFTAEEATNLAGVGVFQVKLIILCGFVWMARGFEVIILRSISSLLACEWKMKRWQGAVITTASFLSTVLGCFLYGIWSDRYGRRMALSSSVTLLFVFTAVSAGLRNYTWFAVFKAVSAFAIGGLPQSLVLCCEYMPGRQRGRAIYILSCFFGLGALIMMYALFTTKELENGWRIFIAIGALPAFVTMVMMRFFPESFRFLMVIQKHFAANEMVAEMAESNRKMIKGRLVPPEEPKRKTLILGLLRQPFIGTTLLLWTMGLFTAITFLALNLMTQTLISRETATETNTVNMTANFFGEQNAPITCIKYNPPEGFVLEAWTTALDFSGFIIYLLLVDVIDRKKLLCAAYFISSIFIFLLCLPSTNFIMYIAFIYIARILLLGLLDLLLLITAETFPTSHRGTAVGLEASSFYLGQLLSSYILQSLSWVSSWLPAVFFGTLIFLCAVAAMCLKRETRGQELMDIIKKNNNK